MATKKAEPLADRLKRWRADRMAFRREAIILEDGRLLGEVMEPWQEEDFRALDDPAHRHGYIERPRGHTKTGDIGTEAVGELYLGRPGSLLYCYGADEDQGRLLRDDVAGKIARNPLLAPLVKHTKNSIIVKATGSRLTVMAADAPSNYGLRPDWIAGDEFVEWRGRALWDSLWTATGKRPHCRVLIISSAGWDRTQIAWEVRQNAEREANWYFSSRGQCASWIDPAWLAQQQRTLPAHVYARLHLNQWVEGAGAFLLASEVDRIFATGLRAGDGPRAIGVDLGLARDASVVSLVRANAVSGGVDVEALVTWTPRSGERVDLREVEDEVGRLALTLRAPVVVDPWQAMLMAQRLRAAGVAVVEYPFTSDGRRKLFGVLLDLIRSGTLRSHPHEALRRELLGLEVQETAAGWRVDHRVGRHDDHAVAVALGLAGLMGTPGDTSEPSPAEIRELRALQRDWGFAGAGIVDDDGQRVADDVVYDADLGMAMDDPNYPRW
jgi:hypothetical protein